MLKELYGGIVGLAQGTDKETISFCKNTAKVSDTKRNDVVEMVSECGGIIGRTQNMKSVDNCENYGEITRIFAFCRRNYRW